MSDPFLLAHWAAPRIYDISGKLSPVSVRDQMMRGRLFAERAFATGEISPRPDEGLVVAGAGAGGMTAALTAVSLGVQTTVLEQSPRLFRTQAACRTRWIDPTQYDWPLDFWPLARFPISGSIMPLPWAADWADQVGALWLAAVQQFLSTFAASLLRIHTSATLGAVSSAPGTGALQVPYRSPSGSGSPVCGALLLAVGFGTEKVDAGPTYRGFTFWETDKLAQARPSYTGSSGPRVLISGGGDGALQDFLRIMTGKNSAAEVLQTCALPVEVAAALKDLDRVVSSALHWGDGARHDHEWHRLLDNVCYQLSGDALKQAALRQSLKSLLALRPSRIRVVYGCDHLTSYYLLNRFLTILVSEYVRQEDGTKVLGPGMRLVDVSASGRSHACGQPLLCFGQPHDVSLAPAPDCRAPVNAGPLPPSTWDVIVVRHGLAAGSQTIAGLTPLAHPRQILPYMLF